MLTYNEFETLWSTDFAELPVNHPNHPENTFSNYVERECHFQNYIDLFRGRDTRIKRGCDTKESHPFEEHLTHKRCINNVLIGEGPNALNTSKMNTCGGDTNNTYFYNPVHVGTTPFFNAPYGGLVGGPLLWGTPRCPIDKIKMLVNLADKGVVLLDLFPFAASLSGARLSIILHRIYPSYWDGANPYSVKKRLTALSSLFSKTKIKACFIAPPTLSKALATYVNSGMPLTDLGLFFNWTPAAIAANIYSCVASNGANVPGANEIRIAL